MNQHSYIKNIFKLLHEYDNGKLSIDDLIRLIDSGKINFPKHLYKYRNCNNESFSALNNKRCYFNLPSCWNDTTDSTISFDFEKDLKKLKNSKTAVPLSTYHIIKNFLDNNNLNSVLSFDDFQKIYNSLFPDGVDWSEEYSFSRFTRNAIGINEIHKAVNHAFASLLSTNEIRNQHLMLSLSSTYKNNMMWEKYSDIDSGFCIKYNIKKFVKKNPFYVLSILPIYYGNKKPISFLEYLDAGFDQKNVDNGIFNISRKLYVSMLTKDKEYAGEQEWRFICEDKDIENKLRVFDCAEAIYLGSKINEDNKNKLLEISKNIGLKVYERKFIKYKNIFEYRKINF